MVIDGWEKDPGRLYNQTPYPGDTKGDINHQSYKLDNLQNGQTYMALVRAVGIDGNESKSSNIVTFMTSSRGEFIITSEHSDKNGGFSFDEEKSVTAYDPSCDIYLYATESKAGLSSPNHLTPGMRKSHFTIYPGNLLDPDFDTMIINSGDSLAVQTKNGKAYLRIKNIDGQYPNISCRIAYNYVPKIL